MVSLQNALEKVGLVFLAYKMRRSMAACSAVEIEHAVRLKKVGQFFKALCRLTTNVEEEITV